MYIKNRLIALKFRIVLVIISSTGILLTIAREGYMGGFAAFNFYTIQANALGLIYFVMLCVYGHIDISRNGIKGESTLLPGVKMAVTMAVFSTGIIFNIIISPGMKAGSAEYLSSVENFAVHTLVPALTVFDWLLFCAKGKLRWFDPFLWELIPLGYVVFAFVRANFEPKVRVDSRFSYYFLDIDEIGVGGVAVYIVVIALSFLVLGMLWYFMDRLMKKMMKKKADG